MQSGNRGVYHFLEKALFCSNESKCAFPNAKFEETCLRKSCESTIACGHTARDTAFSQTSVTQVACDLDPNAFELRVTMMDVPYRASLGWLELKKLQKFQEEFQQPSDVELAETSGKGEAFSHQPVSHISSNLHSGVTLQ